MVKVVEVIVCYLYVFMSMLSEVMMFVQVVHLWIVLSSCYGIAVSRQVSGGLL